MDKMPQEGRVNGKDAVVMAAEDAGVEAIICVPGYPVTNLAEVLKAEIAVNEKVAMEIALGSSASGKRSIVITKQLGMNLLADPLVISATHTTGSGIVVLVGDDLGPKGSQAEMDSRYFGLISGLPVLDPSDPFDLYHSLMEAYTLSEEIRAPVIVRATSRLLDISGDPFERASLKPSGIKFDRSIWDLSALGRQQRYQKEAFPLAEEASEATYLHNLKISGKVGIIAIGCPSRLAESLDASLLKIVYAHPLPWGLIKSFIKSHDRVVIAEEPWPFLESQLRASDKVVGRLTGHLPWGPLEIEDLQGALGMALAPSGDFQRPGDKALKAICDDCPFSSLFLALRATGATVAGDAGCTIRAIREPYSSVDQVYGLGSSPGVASGFFKAGCGKGIAVVGDYGFAHSGLQGLINAVWKGRDILMILIQNGVAAQTGGQEVPDLTQVLEALVPVRCLDLPHDGKDAEKVLREEMAVKGSSAILVRGKCPRS